MSVSRLARALVALALVLAPAAPHAAAAPHAGSRATAAPRNLLQNPGFERTMPGQDWMPSNWDTSDAGMTTVFFGRDSLAPHAGHYSVSIANTSTLYHMGHNWSQTLLVGKETWGKEAVLSVWTRSAGVQGRAYVLLQAYRDTCTKMSRIWGVTREEAMDRLGIVAIADPAIELGWKRTQFRDAQTDWVRREARIYVAPGTNVLFVRCGLFGVGQVSYDDASLTLEAPPPAPVYPAGKNLLVDPDFEGSGDDWEWVIPPYEGARLEPDSEYAHSGHLSIRGSHMHDGLVNTRMGMAQVFPGRGLGGKRLRISGWFRTDSLTGGAYVRVYCQTPTAQAASPGVGLLTDTYDWRQVQSEVDVPRDAVEIWAWLAFNAPATGTIWLDDARLEIVGPASGDTTGAKPAKARTAKRAATHH
ncbi:MAG TPA: hypothetical protein VMH61_05185 [Candidatus Acidoferrales bacterium]|nr:hypothetical protein [Candidatus Acidoferrales bacterium]